MDCVTSFNISSLMLLIVGAIHIVPVIGVLGQTQLSKLYGINFTDHNSLILAMHRAVLFGILGIFWIYAAFIPSLQALAYLSSTVSVISFLWISLAVGNYNSKLLRVVNVDVIALSCILIGTIAYYNQCFDQEVIRSTCRL